MLRAILWDVDGTLAETERDGHLPAFNRAFAALELPWRWSESRYGELLQVSGGRERLQHDLAMQPAAPADPAERAALIDRIHRLKNEFYAGIVGAGSLPLRGGVSPLMQDCRDAGISMGIATTTSEANVAALLGRQLGPQWRSSFRSVVCAEQAPRKKPDPQVYLRSLALLGLPPAQVLAIEDAPAGAAAARAAGIAALVVRSFYFPDGALPDVIAVGASLGSAADWSPAPQAAPAARIDLSQLQRWHARWRQQAAHPGGAG